MLADLTERVTEHRVTALLGPRRFGKTSVLRRLAHDLTEVSTVAVDLFGVQTHANIALRLAAAMQEAVRGGPRTPLLGVFDEFQSIAAVKGATAVLRTELQHHYDRISLLFAGSAPSAMRDIFSRHDQPFFNQADLVTIAPLDAPSVHEIVTGGFRSTGRDPGGIASLVFALTAGHPQRTMRAADEVWRHTGPGEVADDRWGAALASLREAESATLTAIYAELAGDEKKVLRVYANGGALFGSAAERVELSAGGADHARQRLLADGKLRTDSDGNVVVTDPLLADWLRQSLPL